MLHTIEISDCSAGREARYCGEVIAFGRRPARRAARFLLRTGVADEGDGLRIIGRSFSPSVRRVAAAAHLSADELDGREDGVNRRLG